MATSTKPDSNNFLLYLIGGILGLGLALVLLGLLYFGLGYLASNLFLSLDTSAYGRGAGGWAGYALLGLGLGAAAGAVAAWHRFRLNKLVLVVAGLVAATSLAFVLVGNTAHFAPPPASVTYYETADNQGQCPACATITASSTRPDAVPDRYAAANLLDKDPATAWISATPRPMLRLLLTLPADQRLIGLRLRNGYAKSRGTYASFGRVRIGRVRLNGAPEASYALPDAPDQDLFIPLALPTGTISATLTFQVSEAYAGENHPEEVALSALVPVIELVK